MAIPSLPSSPSMATPSSPKYTTDEIKSLLDAGVVRDPFVLAQMMSESTMSGAPSEPTAPAPTMPTAPGMTPETLQSQQMPLAATTEAEPTPTPTPNELLTAQEFLNKQQERSNQLVDAQQQALEAADGVSQTAEYLQQPSAPVDVTNSQEVAAANNRIISASQNSMKAYDDLITMQNKAMADAQTEYDAIAKDSEQTFWGSMSDGNRVLAAISLALGAYAEGLSQGKIKSGAAQVIEGMSRDWARAQGQKADNARTKLSSVQQTYKMEADILQNKKAAELSLAEAYLKAASTKATQMATTESSKRALAKFQMDLAESQAKISKEKAEILEKQNKLAAEKDLMKVSNTRELNPEEVPEKYRTRIIPEWGVATTGTEKQVAEVRDFDTDTRIANEIGQRLLKYQGMGESALVRALADPEQRKRIDEDVRAFGQKTKKAVVGPGNVLSDLEQKLMADANPKFDNWLPYTDFFYGNKGIIEGRLYNQAEQLAQKAKSIGLREPSEYVANMLSQYGAKDKKTGSSMSSKPNPNFSKERAEAFKKLGIEPK